MASVIDTVSINVAGLNIFGSSTIRHENENICLLMSADGNGNIFLHGTRSQLLDFADAILKAVIPQKEDSPEDDAEAKIAAEGLDAAGMNDGK